MRTFHVLANGKIIHTLEAESVISADRIVSRMIIECANGTEIARAISKGHVLKLVSEEYTYTAD